MPSYYLAPLLAGFIYAVAVLLSKRAMENGAGVARTLLVNNWTLALFFVPVFYFSEGSANWDVWYWPALGGVSFFFGQVTTFNAIRLGDISVQAPIMGSKVIFIAILTVMFSDSLIPPSWWAGAVLATTAVFFLNAKKTALSGSMWPAVFSALASAGFFALGDFIIQEKAKAFGHGKHGLVMFAVSAILSFAAVPYLKGGLFKMPRATLPSFLAANFLLASQATILYMVLSYHGKATAVNILYSSRGVWSILLIWFAGKWFYNKERADAGGFTMAKRLFGAVLMTVAIFIVLSQ
jgi:drug/metabolite transporter (DMT)-like permease